MKNNFLYSKGIIYSIIILIIISSIMQSTIGIKSKNNDIIDDNNNSLLSNPTIEVETDKSLYDFYETVQIRITKGGGTILNGTSPPYEIYNKWNNIVAGIYKYFMNTSIYPGLPLYYSWNQLHETSEVHVPSGTYRIVATFEDYSDEAFFDISRPPEKPEKPTGPTSGHPNENYMYSSKTYDKDDDDELYYMFDWGDDTNTDWIGPFMSNEIVYDDYSWSEKGNYEIKVKAKDEYEQESYWSSYLNVIIEKENNAPLKPSKPVGIINGTINEEYNYSTSTSDPDGDQVYYKWDWDGETSGWLGPYNSGVTISTSNIWDDEGDYEIKVKVKDVYGDESPWSDPLTVTMPRVKTFNQIPRILLWLFERFPFLQPYFSIFYN